MFKATLDEVKSLKKEMEIYIKENTKTCSNFSK